MTHEGPPNPNTPSGVWQRDWMRRHGGNPETDVTVRYVQTANMFGDLRIPADRPDLSRATSLADLTDQELIALQQQQGFAGFATLDGMTMTWHHEIDYQPTSGESDIGRIERTGAGKMLEHAPDDSYVESWSLLSKPEARFLAIEVVHKGRVAQILSIVGDHFIYARNRSHNLPKGKSLRAVVDKAKPDRNQLIDYLDCEVSYGFVRGGAMPWEVILSTLPWRQGKPLEMVDRIVIDGNGQPSARAAVPDETWTIPINTLSPEELFAMFPAAG